MVIEQLKNSIIFLDTAPLIYFIEGHSQFQDRLVKLFHYNDENYFRFLTSSLTLLEVLVKPMRDGEHKIVEQYKSILTNAEGLDIFDITIQIAVKSAEIRAKYNVRTPDAIQIATAIERKADYFLTNDQQLKKISDINVILIDDLI